MRAIVYADTVQFTDDYPEPQITRDDDVKLKILYCGVCGTDLKELTDGPIFFPKDNDAVNPISHLHARVMGHEISAQVVEVGAAVTTVRPGDYVVVEVTGTCGDKPRFDHDITIDGYNLPVDACVGCRQGCYNACTQLGLTGLGFSDGGLSEYMVTAERKLIKYDESKIPADVAALVQPLAVSWHAVEVSKYVAGTSVLILGGGPIGLATIFALKGHGVGSIVVSEPASRRRQFAQKLGAEVYNPLGSNVEQNIKDLMALSPGKNGYHYVYDCSGLPETFETSIACLRVRGVATNVAIWADKSVPFFPMSITHNERMVTGSMCFTKDDFQGVVDAIEQGRIDVEELKHLITQKSRLEDCQKTFESMLYNRRHNIKTLFHP
ncbi:hypothetical protein DIURU_004546 [Diutina rugosa]|uniref:Enoyl reductase (ER) domain-containing protein n=1 Tax=Diutina rugosa TaxID=5481 RepID=A0A642UGX7_DIURU|nr:uncharacterized protein DIURU_004546 [Diutina rugosa]KAA8898702.1 hypothetical protein DIURU_004546 [Diutina rugosa]